MELKLCQAVGVGGNPAPCDLVLRIGTPDWPRLPVVTGATGTARSGAWGGRGGAWVEPNLELGKGGGGTQHKFVCLVALAFSRGSTLGGGPEQRGVLFRAAHSSRDGPPLVD